MTLTKHQTKMLDHLCKILSHTDLIDDLIMAEAFIFGLELEEYQLYGLNGNEIWNYVKAYQQRRWVDMYLQKADSEFRQLMNDEQLYASGYCMDDWNGFNGLCLDYVHTTCEVVDAASIHARIKAHEFKTQTVEV